MMRVEPLDEDPNLNVMLRSGITTRDDNRKQSEENGWVHRAPQKEFGFDLERANEKFMEAKKTFVEASTSGSQNRVPETRAPTEVNHASHYGCLQGWVNGRILWPLEHGSGLGSGHKGLNHLHLLFGSSYSTFA